jgi:hypothetical protein
MRVGLAHSHVVERFFDGAMIVMRVFCGLAMMPHPFIERLLHGRNEQRRGKDAQGEDHVGQIFPDAAHGDTPARVRSAVEQDPEAAADHEGEGEEDGEQPGVGEGVRLGEEEEG